MMVPLGKEGPAGHGVLLAGAVATSCGEPRASTGTRADGGTCVRARPQAVATGSGPQSESLDIEVEKVQPCPLGAQWGKAAEYV